MTTGTFHRIGGLALIMSLSACGGGGSGVGSTPNPPSASYTKMSELTGKRTFNSSSVRLSAGSSVFGPTTDFGDGVKISYDATAGSYTLEADGRTQSFGPSDANMSPVLGPALPNAQPLLFRKADGSDLIIQTPNPDGIDLSYTRLASWTNMADLPRSYVLVYGMPTTSRDMPRSGSATYSRLQVTGVIASSLGVRSLANSTGSFTADFGAGTVQTTIEPAPVLGPIAAVPTPSATLSGSGMIAAGSSSFSGTMTGQSMTGIFAGSFFGPQAAEFGYAFSMNGSGGSGPMAAVGTVVGAK